MDFTIRRATEKDVPAMLDLIGELARFEKEPDAVIINEETLLQEGFSEQPLFKAFVAEQNGTVAGMALFYYRFSTWKGRTIHLEDLIVREESRGLGIGKALYEKVLSYARKQQVKRVEWVVLDWNKHAIDFYQRSGANILKGWYTVQMDEEQLLKKQDK